MKNTFGDRCTHENEICSRLSPGAECSKDENTCVCSPDFYRTTTGSRICGRNDREKCQKGSIDFLARAVGLSCSNTIDCGEFGECRDRICACKANRIEQEDVDILGRSIRTCVIQGKLLFHSFCLMIEIF